MKRLLPILLWLVCIAPVCDPCSDIKGLSDYGSPTKLAVGDSIQAIWHPTCKSLTDIASLGASSYVLNKSVSGARLSASDRLDIRSQYEVGGPWKFVIINGGANDLAVEGCNASTVDALATEMQAFVNLIKSDGDPVPKIIVLGMYHTRLFGICSAEFDAASAKYQALDGIVYVPISDIMDPILHPENFNIDGLHPSEAGAALIGQRLAPLLK